MSRSPSLPARPMAMAPFSGLTCFQIKLSSPVSFFQPLFFFLPFFSFFFSNDPLLETRPGKTNNQLTNQADIFFFAKKQKQKNVSHLPPISVYRLDGPPQRHNPYSCPRCKDSVYLTSIGVPVICRCQPPILNWSCVVHGARLVVP